MYEPGYRRHGLGDPLGECGNLSLEVDQEGVRPPLFNYLDGAVRDMGLMEGHGATRAQGMGADLMGVESQALEAKFRAVSRRWRTVSDPVTDFGAAPGAA